MFTGRLSRVAIALMLISAVGGLYHGFRLSREVVAIEYDVRYLGAAVPLAAVFFVYLRLFRTWWLEVASVRRLVDETSQIELLHQKATKLAKDLKPSVWEGADVALLIGGSALAVVGIITAPVGGLVLAVLGGVTAGGDAVVKFRETQKAKGFRKQVTDLRDGLADLLKSETTKQEPNQRES